MAQQKTIQANIETLNLEPSFGGFNKLTVMRSLRSYIEVRDTLSFGVQRSSITGRGYVFDIDRGRFSLPHMTMFVQADRGKLEVDLNQRADYSTIGEKRAHEIVNVQ